ncbi:dTDP-4-dehydrorhamnose 3,5-epimerase [Butyrivibrio sp. AD3002]|uniref:dTDP-4-dehydrorhamnose 3,5-epimerase n=1 Tax=Butyrivibrio sp. AD3002 TaxID=1280670 RepID=UPI0003B31E6D|nr:dTDP-4-dehydrorhamnose 3,5-epimerase [Butyrivibrio sp. AD3002]
MSGFKFVPMSLEGAFCIEAFSVGDLRGGFTKTFEKDIYEEAGIEFLLNETFVSTSAKNVIRGLHFQTHNPQAKLVTVVAGRAWDVIVDLRIGSPTYKKWEAVELSAENHKAVYVPRGFGHGFASLEDGTIMMYQCDGAYDAATDTGIRFDEHAIGITWPVHEDVAIHSNRDMALMSIAEYEQNPMSDF